MAKFRKHPDGEWPGFPGLKLEDIDHEYFQINKWTALSMVDTLKARIVVKLDKDEIRDFMAAVAKKKGDTSALNVDEAAREALKAWMEVE
ncbi:MAG: hypothetical protein ACE5OZ_10100 [Candidatus Heimdallarchaeota archaeon]